MTYTFLQLHTHCLASEGPVLALPAPLPVAITTAHNLHLALLQAYNEETRNHLGVESGKNLPDQGGSVRRKLRLKPITLQMSRLQKGQSQKVNGPLPKSSSEDELEDPDCLHAISRRRLYL